MEDVQLIHALQTRQDGAMEQFQTAYTPLLRYIIAPILPDERDREECLSDVLLRVWDSIGTFDPGKAALTTWLTHLTRNAALNRRRANERRRESGNLDETMPLAFWFDTDNAGTPCYYANFSLPEDVSGPTEAFLFWEATPTFPETISLYNYSVTTAHRHSFWQYPYTLPSEILASGFYPPSWQWRMYQWTSEGHLAPEGMYDPQKY